MVQARRPGSPVSGILCTASLATVQGGVTACTATSDPRLKDYTDSPYGLDAIMHIQPIKFRWNELGRQYNANDTTEHLGFNAQNIQQVMPEAVGTETHDGTDYLSLPHGTDGIVAALVKAVQEQQAQIEPTRLMTMQENAVSGEAKFLVLNDAAGNPVLDCEGKTCALVGDRTNQRRVAILDADEVLP